MPYYLSFFISPPHFSRLKKHTFFFFFILLHYTIHKHCVQKHRLLWYLTCVAVRNNSLVAFCKFRGRFDNNCVQLCFSLCANARIILQFSIPFQLFSRIREGKYFTYMRTDTNALLFIPSKRENAAQQTECAFLRSLKIKFLRGVFTCHFSKIP